MPQDRHEHLVEIGLQGQPRCGPDRHHGVVERAPALRARLRAMKDATLGAARNTPVSRGSPAACRAPR